MRRFEAFFSRDSNRLLHMLLELPISSRTRILSSQLKRSCRSLSTISSRDSRIRRRASINNVSEHSVHLSGSKLFESRKQVSQHVFKIPRLLSPLQVLCTTREVPLRHSLRVTSRTLLTRILLIVIISRHRDRVTHEVNNPQTRIPVNRLRNRHYETTRVQVTALHFTNPRRTRAQLTLYPPRNRLSQIAGARNQSRT